MMDLVDRAFEVVNEAYKDAEYNVRALLPAMQVVCLIDELDFEVALGGVLGWLINRGEYGPDTVKALEAVGAHQCASIVREILAFFPEGTPAAEDKERVRQILAVEDVSSIHWSALGARLLTWPDDIYALLHKFIEEHEADFF